MITHKDPAVQQVGFEIANALADLEQYFKPGVKLTCIVRRPRHPEQDIVITNDDLKEVAQAIERRRAAEERPYPIIDPEPAVLRPNAPRSASDGTAGSEVKK